LAASLRPARAAGAGRRVPTCAGRGRRAAVPRLARRPCWAAVPRLARRPCWAVAREDGPSPAKMDIPRHNHPDRHGPWRQPRRPSVPGRSPGRWWPGSPDRRGRL